MTPSNDNYVISVRRAAEQCGMSARTLKRLADEGNGPKLLQLSPRRIGIRVRDLNAWIDQCEITRRQ